MLNANVGGGDLGYWWRVQSVRSLDDLDKLVQYKYYFAKKLGPEKCKEIEDDVLLFADADQFRIYHAKGRWRATWCAIATTMVGTTQLNGGRNGIGMFKSQPLVAWGLFFGSWAVYYQFWSRYAGYTS